VQNDETSTNKHAICHRKKKKSRGSAACLENENNVDRDKGTAELLSSDHASVKRAASQVPFI
jgi:hypothetical protein